MRNITIKSIRDKQAKAEEVTNKFFNKPKDENFFEEGPVKKKNNKLVRLVNFASLIVFVLIIGGMGGIAMDRFAIPYLMAKYPELNQYEFLKRVNERTTIVKVTEEVKISEDTAIVEAIKKVFPSIVQILAPDDLNNDEYAYKGTGIILTSDGYIITSLKNISGKEETPSVSAETKKKEGEINNNKILLKVRLSDSATYDAEIINENAEKDLAIIKINEKNLPVLPLANSDELELGEKLVIIDDSIAVDIISKFINDYIPTSSTNAKPQKRAMISQHLDSSFSGAAVANLKGEIIGISGGDNLFIATNELKEFINSVIK